MFVSPVVFTVAMFSFSVASTLWCVRACIFCDVYMHELVFFCGNYMYPCISKLCCLCVCGLCLLFVFLCFLCRIVCQFWVSECVIV